MRQNWGLEKRQCIIPTIWLIIEYNAMLCECPSQKLHCFVSCFCFLKRFARFTGQRDTVLLWCFTVICFEILIKSRFRTVAYVNTDLVDRSLAGTQQPGGMFHPCLQELLAKGHSVMGVKDSGKLSLGHMQLLRQQRFGSVLGHMMFKKVINDIGVAVGG